MPDARRLSPRRLSRPLAVWLTATLLIVAIGGVPEVLPRLWVCTEGWLPGDAGLVSGPYLQNVTANEATVRWWSERDEPGTFTYSGTGATTTLAPTGGELREVHLTGLQPGAEYAYHVKGEAREGGGTIQTDPGPEATVTIGVIGDSGIGSDAQHDVARELAGMAPDLALHTGDVVYHFGSLCEYQRGYFDPYEDLLPYVPIYPAIGNHELDTGDGAPYLRIFDLPADSGGEERFYSFDYGPVHVVALDSERYHAGDPAAVETQRAWLEADLAAAARPWAIVLLHRPLYTTSEGNDEPKLRADLAPIFARYGVDLVLSGHVHAYERFHPLAGVTYVVTGGGGAALHDDLHSDPMVAASAVAYHALQLVATPSTLTLAAIDRHGAVFDRLELSDGG